MWRWIVLSLAAMACGHAAPVPVSITKPRPPVVAPAPPAPPLPLDQDLHRLVDRTLALYAALGDALAGGCDEITAHLATVADSFADVVAATAKVIHDGRGSDLHAALAARDAQFAELGRRVMASPAIAACAGDAAFIAALDKAIGVGGSP